MPLSDLTGTKWVLNSSIQPFHEADFRYYAINYISNGNNYSSIYYDDDGNILYGLQYIGNTVDTVYSYSWDSRWQDGTWSSPAYRIIEITGGTDATNATLIAWLQANATQVEVTDLSGTSWEFGNNLTITSSNLWSVDCALTSDIEATFEEIEIQYFNGYSELSYNYLASGVWSSDNGWINDDNAYKSISITSGTDTANPDLIAWLTNNATYQAPVVGNTYEITHSLTNLTHGNVSFTIAPDTGYSLPSSVTVTNGTLVSYDSSTGVVVVSGDSAEISVTCEVAPSYHEVTVTMSFPSAQTVYWTNGVTSGQTYFNNGNSFTTLTEIIQVPINSITPGAYTGVTINWGNYADGGSGSATGDISPTTSDFSSLRYDEYYEVSGNGTITINITSWD